MWELPEKTAIVILVHRHPLYRKTVSCRRSDQGRPPQESLPINTEPRPRMIAKPGKTATGRYKR